MQQFVYSLIPLARNPNFYVHPTLADIFAE